MQFVREKDVAGARQEGCAGQGSAANLPAELGHQRLRAITERMESSRSRPREFHVHLGRDGDGICGDMARCWRRARGVTALIDIVGLAAGWKILTRKRHERQQGGLARASKPNACSSRAVVPACVLAVSEGRTLRAGRLASHRGRRGLGQWLSLHT